MGGLAPGHDPEPGPQIWRERVVEVLDSRPYTNLELMVGKAVALVAASWVPLVVLAVLLNGLGFLQGRFIQVSDTGGGFSEGTFYMAERTRLRFEYDPPEEALVMAGGGTVAVFDDLTYDPPIPVELQSFSAN